MKEKKQHVFIPKIKEALANALGKVIMIAGVMVIMFGLSLIFPGFTLPIPALAMSLAV